MDFIRSLDPKLVTTVVVAAITRVAVELLGVAESDPLLQGVIALVAGAIAGYWKANDGTVLRTPQESGNPDAPTPLREAGAIDLMTVLIVLGIIVLLVVLVGLVDFNVKGD